MRKIQVGVVGSGMISALYLDTMMHRFGDVLQVRACASRGEYSAMRRAAQFGIQAMTKEEMFRDPEIELIVNLTPVAAHADIVEQALMAGKHVYTEKTLAETSKQAENLLRLAQERHLLLCCAPDTVLSAGIQTARKALSEGAIGQVTSCNMTMNRDYGALYEKMPFLLKPGAGSGMDIGPYFFACAAYLLGPVSLVTGLADASRPIRTDCGGNSYHVKNENRFMAVMQFRSGVMGTFHMNADSGGPEEPMISLYGTEGILRIYAPNKFCNRVTLLRKNPEELDMVKGYTELLRGLGVAEMAVALRKGRTPILTAQAGYHTLEVIQAVYQSCGNGRTIGIRSDIPECSRRPFTPDMAKLQD